ncbi:MULTISPECIES: nickel/cobalt transporter [unclassified Frankia]|uniref:nickel/cobalt transporter n=1 Tax=unclassified Frankia TaxID=2632575 RepID=UPI002AD59ED6|nr:MULTISPECIES: sulfite exporter TauE/SafE family protein [unclassified Frankia]
MTSEFVTLARHLARWAAVFLLTATGSVLVAIPAQAHPTDEVLQQAYLTPTSSRLAVQLDLTPGVLVAPAFARAIDTDGNQTISAGETAAHVDLVTSTLQLRVDGQAVPLTVTRRTYPAYDLPAAAGGAVTIELSAGLAPGSRYVVLTDGYSPGRTTVQMDVLVAGADPANLDTITHADEGRTITLALAQVGITSAAPSPDHPALATTSKREVSNGATMLRALRTPLRSPWALLALIATSALLGAFHALTPGHGKALLASYLVGSRSTPRQAVTLGAVVTVTHTSAVVVLGVLVLTAGRFIVPGVLVPSLEVTTGIVVLILGVRLVVRRLRHRGAHDHEHGPTVHHQHAPPVLPSTLRGIAAMGVSGGIIPCPEALSVLLLAIGLNRTVLGLTMVVAFSVGLAAVLVGLGLILVSARATLDRFRRPGSRPLIAWLPVLSAAVVTVLGLTMTFNGVTGLMG